MEGNSGNKMWVWIVGLLVVCNISLLTTIWYKQAGANNSEVLLPPGPQGGGPGANFDRFLGFTREQNLKFDIMRVNQRNKIDSIKSLAKNTREQFFMGLKTGVNNPTQLDSLGTVLGNYHKQIELQTYNHFREVREILTDKQKVVFDSIIVDVLRSLPEQPRFRGDGIRNQRRGPDGYGPPPPSGRFNHPPPPGEDGPPPPPPGGDDNR